MIKIHAQKRTGGKDFIQTIREALTEFYGARKQVVGMGGVFRIHSGSIRSHIMPGFVEVRSVCFISFIYSDKE